MSKVGVLAFQGDVREHSAALERLGAAPVLVKTRDDLASVDALIIPGGESTTIGKLLDRFDMIDPIADRAASGFPIYGTCAGLILLAASVTGKHDAPHRLGLLDIEVARNGYGRQVDSFESELEVKGLASSFRAVFIRAPIIESVGDAIEVLARCDGRPVLVRSANLMASSFHPEMTGDDRVHEMFLETITGANA
ncbi:MAG TPA: pyridoxal 5'-phosphate synthase glutaminase subunit PdxT [Actinomycetota bacterium]|nr:pyridoxal 5'-phosphate synthase glutaminase subunit PdxT [Actinomycetota bacterium]